MQTITATNEMLPIIDHIQQLQAQMKLLEADLKQHKQLLQDEYMGDASKILSREGLTLAQIVNQVRESFQTALLKVDNNELYQRYVKSINVSFLKVG